MNRKNLFCRSLSRWLIDSPWSYTALLTSCINVVENLPDDIDQVVDRLVAHFRAPPTLNKLEAYLRKEASIQAWFLWRDNLPRVARWNLSALENKSLLSPELPTLNNESELAAWLGLSHGELIWLAGRYRRDNNRPIELTNYHYSVIQKRRGGVRLLESPKSLLKDVQRQIYSEILTAADIDQSAMGFRKGGSCKLHAQHHVNKRHLFTFDLKDFFPSIGWHQVNGVFKRMGYDPDIARYLAGLCTHRVVDASQLPSELDEDQFQLAQLRHLPQGAPTSPALSNAVCVKLDRRLRGLATSLHLSYSRYADDLAFSGDQHRDWRFLEPLVGSICLEEGFALNFRKTRRVRQSQRQQITGVVVNRKTNIDRRYYDQLKAVLNNCLRHGLTSQNHDGHNDFYAHLQGRVNHVYELNPARGSKLRATLAKIQADS